MRLVIALCRDPLHLSLILGLASTPSISLQTLLQLCVSLTSEMIAVLRKVAADILIDSTLFRHSVPC